MTLVIAGYMYSPKTVKLKFRGVQDSLDVSSQLEVPKNPTGIFIAADSTISNGVNTLLSGFRKIYPVVATIYKPYFLEEYFKGYINEHSTVSLLLAFAGSTLTAQHYLNSINTHLSKLLITYKRDANGRAFYTITTDCDQENLLYKPGQRYGYDMFTPDEMTSFKPTANELAVCVLHSLQHVLKSARKYKIDGDGVKSLDTPFIAGIQCPRTNEYKIFKYTYNFDWSVIPVNVEVVMDSVPPDQVAVLGMGGHFDEAAQEAYTNACSAGHNTEEKMFEFLNASIDSSKAEGNVGIDRPSILRTMVNGKFTVDRKFDENPDLIDLNS